MLFLLNSQFLFKGVKPVGAATVLVVDTVVGVNEVEVVVVVVSTDSVSVYSSEYDADQSDALTRVRVASRQ